MTNNVVFSLKEKGQSLTEAGQVSTGASYFAAAASLSRFIGKKSIMRFSEITKDKLEAYEEWMLREGKRGRNSKVSKPASATTIGFYARCLRAVYNQALEAGLFKPTSHAFGRGGYVIPSSTNSRTPITQDVIKTIMAFDCQSESQRFARDFWVFSYFSNGMNPVDILNLKVRDISVVNMSFSFIREKTKRTRKSKQVLIEGVLFPETVAIVEKRGRPNGKGSDYLFPILNHRMTDAEREARKDYFVKQINRGMKSIGEALGLDCDLRSYVARHSFCNAMIQNETPIAFVSQALGHARISTTEHYFGRFSNEKTKAYLSALSPS